MRTLVTAALSLLALLLGTSSAHAITGDAVPDGDDHPHVVAIVFVQDDAVYACSGTLLSPTTVLTAGHCLEDAAGDPNDVTYVSNDPNALALLPGREVPTEDRISYLEASDRWVAGEPTAHEGYDGFASFPATYDIGVVVLETGIDTGGIYGQLPEEGMLDALMTAKGATTDRQVVVVGYGMQGTVPEDSYTRLRYQGTATIAGLGRSVIEGSQNVRLTNAPGKGTGGSGTCYGDSGGPAFWVDPATGEETNIVVAVTSFGITGGQCVGTGYSFRTDTAWVREFLARYL